MATTARGEALRALLFALGGIFVNIYALVQAHQWHELTYGAHPPRLRDVGFDLLPEAWCPEQSWLLDAIPGVFLALSLLVVLAEGRYTTLALAFRMVGLTFFLRGLSILLTILPDPYPKCMRRELFNSTLGEVGKVLAENPMLVTSLCGHCLFSGHACTLSLVALIWQRLDKPLWAATAVLVWAGEVLGMLVCRFHYTCDVVWGIVVAFAVFNYVMPARRLTTRLVKHDKAHQQ